MLVIIGNSLFGSVFNLSLWQSLTAPLIELKLCNIATEIPLDFLVNPLQYAYEKDMLLTPYFY